MSSLLFYQVSITLLLLPFLSFSTEDDNRILDNHGLAITTFYDYYIIPVHSTYKGALGYNPKGDSCPLYINTNIDYNIPVTFSFASNSQYINLDERVSIAFNGRNPCTESLVWRRTLDPLTQKEYITTGGVEGNKSFSITQEYGDQAPYYVLKYWPSSEGVGSANVGLYDDNGVLGLTKSPTRVYFQIASVYLEVSTS